MIIQCLDAGCLCVRLVLWCGWRVEGLEGWYGGGVMRWKARPCNRITRI